MKMAGMSRARFAVHFREVVGETPGEYLASWRIMLAQRLLKNGRQLKDVVDEVGYASSSALTRAFVRKQGCSPTEWLKSQAALPIIGWFEIAEQQDETLSQLLMVTQIYYLSSHNNFESN